MIPAFLLQVVWVLFWTFAAKAIIQKKDKAGAVISPWIWRIARWVCVTPIAALDALVPDEWLEDSKKAPEILQSAGALLAILAYLKGGRGAPPPAPRGRRP